MKEITLITMSLLISLTAFSQVDAEGYMTPEEEFYSGEQVNGDLSELPPEETYFEEMERQEEWQEVYPDEELDWREEEAVDEAYYEEL